MTKRLQVIYVSGLGDANTTGQEKAIATWRLRGVTAYMFAPRWADGEAFEPKLKRLLALIDSLQAQGPVCLIGASAGASMVVNAYAQRPQIVRAVACICGKFDAATVGAEYTGPNPAFGGSMQALAASWQKLSAQDKQRILSIRPLYDETVPVRETMVPGVQTRRVWSVYHAVTIGYMLTLRAGVMLRFLRRTASR